MRRFLVAHLASLETGVKSLMAEVRTYHMKIMSWKWKPYQTESNYFPSGSKISTSVE